MNRNVLIRINTPEPARLWTGAGPLMIPIDDVETEIATYLGGGELIGGLDEIDQLINGKATRFDISTSGVTAAAVKIFLGEQASVIGAVMDIGVVLFDDLWQITDVAWRARYRVDKAAVSRDAERTISLSMGSEDTGRSRSSGAYWTDAAQNRKSPGDRIFDRVAGINAGTSRNFGPSA